MSPWLFNVYMDGVVLEVNVRVLGKGLELLSTNGGRFEINQLLFADDAALVADSEEKLLLLSLLILIVLSEHARSPEEKQTVSRGMPQVKWAANNNSRRLQCQRHNLVQSQSEQH